MIVLRGINRMMTSPQRRAKTMAIDAKEEERLGRQLSGTDYIPSNLPESTISHVILTRDQARQMLRDYKWDVQRKIKYSNVVGFDELFQAGAWDDYTIIELSTTPEGVYVNDGQNRLASIANTGDRAVRIVDTPFASIEAARTHYANTDRNGRKRSTGEAMTAMLYGDTTLSPDQRTKLATAIRFMNSAFNAKGAQCRPGRKFYDHEIAEAMKEWRDIAAECFRMIGKAKRNIRGKLQLCPVLSVMLVTIRYNPSEAQSFWESVVRDNGLKDGQPQKTLITMLTCGDTNIEKLGANVFARKVAAAYNNFCDGDECWTLHAYKNIPIHMHGTPYDRKIDLYYEPAEGLVTM
jgi:hypothetical protein